MNTEKLIQDNKGTIVDVRVFWRINVFSVPVKTVRIKNNSINNFNFFMALLLLFFKFFQLCIIVKNIINIPKIKFKAITNAWN